VTMRLTVAGAACVLTAVTLAACGGGSSASSKAAGKTVTTSAAGTASATTPPGGSTAGHSATARSHLPEGPNHRGPSAHSTTPAHLSSRASAVGSARFKRALASFETCLALHGVKLPSAGGGQAGSALSLKGVDTKSPAYRRALAACIPVIDAALKGAAKSRPGSASQSGGGSVAGGSSGAGGSPGGSGSARLPAVKVPASVTAGFERFTACMRSHGVSGFPEPTGASFDLSGTHLNTHSPRYKAAEAKCDPILQAVDSGGVGE
jgi:hypothetical protein